MKITAGGNRPERWFSQVPADLAGHQQPQAARQPVPARARTRWPAAGLPSPEYVPTTTRSPSCAGCSTRCAARGAATITGYASSLTAAARWATSTTASTSTGVVAYPASEPVTSGKLAAMRGGGHAALARRTPSCPRERSRSAATSCDDEEYHLWDHELAVITRRRPRGDGTEVDAFLWTSLADEAPRVLVNVENDDYGVVRPDVDCACGLGRLGLRTRVADIRGISKVVAAGISLDGESLRPPRRDRAARPRSAAVPATTSSSRARARRGTTMSLRVHPDVDASTKRTCATRSMPHLRSHRQRRARRSGVGAQRWTADRT